MTSAPTTRSRARNWSAGNVRSPPFADVEDVRWQARPKRPVLDAGIMAGVRSARDSCLPCEAGEGDHGPRTAEPAVERVVEGASPTHSVKPPNYSLSFRLA